MMRKVKCNEAISFFFSQNYIFLGQQHDSNIHKSFREGCYRVKPLTHVERGFEAQGEC